MQGSSSIVMNEKDNVATVLRDAAPGETLTSRIGSLTYMTLVLEAIPFGHKIALSLIPAGQIITKYGDPIGRAICDIQPGQHVHIHNIEGIRGRGDLTHAPIATPRAESEGSLS